jgi:hypothetical protein
MGRHNGEAGESPALSRNCKLHLAASQDDPSDRVPNTPRDKVYGTPPMNQGPVNETGLYFLNIANKEKTS